MIKDIIQIDMKKGIVSRQKGEELVEFAIETQEAFSIISDAYIRVGWDTKYVYSFTWMGRPIIQLPDDMMRIQEVIYDLKPDVVIDIGIAHGGSLVFYAGLMKAIGKGRVIGVDLDIRAHNREQIEQHEMFPLIDLIEGNSIATSTVEQIKDKLIENENILIFLDGCHTYDHVMKELEIYSQFLNIGSYIVAMDGVMKNLVGAPRSSEDWATNNPSQAALDFVSNNPNFAIEEPTFKFNEGSVKERTVTYWPNAFIRKLA